MKKLFINLLVVICLFTALEISSRFILKKIYDREFDSSLIVDNKYFSSAGLKENAEGTVWGKKFHTDKFGGRKNKVAFSKAKKKWLFIGDSVTEGVGVEDSLTFASLCSEDFPEFSLLNYSLIGYSSSDYVNVLKYVIQKDSSVGLVTVFYCLNDVYGNSKTESLSVMRKQNRIGKLNELLQKSCATYKLIKLLLYKNANRYFTYDLQFYKRDDAHFQESMNDLRICNSLCTAKNIYFNVVLLPYQSQLTDRNFTPQQLLNEFCKKDSIKYSDASEYLSKQVDINSLYLFADEIHFSDKGHKIIAKFLSE